LSQSHTSRRVFIVGSVRVYRDTLAESLTAEGFSVAGVHAGGAGVVGQVIAVRPDVVIVDIGAAHSIVALCDTNFPGPPSSFSGLASRIRSW
jgi:AmiR/NasT family two-component response regulator